MMTGEIVLMGPGVGLQDSSKTALGILLIAALGIGAFGVANARLSHRSPARRHLRGLGRAIQLWGAGIGRARRRRRR